MRIHILGICGTFMAGIAELAQQSGHTVTGSDLNVYPPMSTQLERCGISLMQGYHAADIPNDVDCVVVGNVVKRGNPAMEYVMEHNIPYMSGPEWLAKNILHNRWVLAVSGTHGKTTTSSMLAFILEYAGYNPGFLIGGVPENFGISARLGSDPFFVMEADEYDSAFFDKRSKFIHYHPKTLILNNLEFDHADIFPDLAAIVQQFHYLIRTVPGNGLIIKNADDRNLDDVIKKGCWSPICDFGGKNAKWTAKLTQPDGSCFEIYNDAERLEEITWNLLGQHNVNNALAAIAAAHHAGVAPIKALEALRLFTSVKRRLEIKGKAGGITLYDDFAHHPTAIRTTLAGLRARIGQARLIVVLEFGSYTMRVGAHKDSIQSALAMADLVVCRRPETLDWDLEAILKEFVQPTILFQNVDDLVKGTVSRLQSGDHVVVMSNSAFGNVHQKLLQALGEKSEA